MGAVPAKPPAMELVRNLIKRVAPEQRPIVLVGDPGVGKRFFANTIHRLSERAGPFEVLDCRTAHLGRAAMQMLRSQGGTFVIEEFLELSNARRVRLFGMLRAPWSTEYHEGARRPPPRIIVTATPTWSYAGAMPVPDQSLRDLNGALVLRIPPLRERADEIPAIAEELLHELCDALGASPRPQITAAAMDALVRHDWPGSIDELSDVLRRAVRLSERGEIRPEHLTSSLQRSPATLAVDRSKEFLSCSFCGVPGHLGPLITGPGVQICHVCVQDTQDMLTAAVDPSPAPSEESDLDCSFCAKSALEVTHLIAADPPPLVAARGDGNVTICDECLALCDGIIAERLTGQKNAQPTITFRAASPPDRVESALARADAFLACHTACNIVVFLDGDPARAAAVLEQTKRALRGRAELFERQSADPPAAVLFALPPPDPSWEDR